MLSVCFSLKAAAAMNTIMLPHFKRYKKKNYADVEQIHVLFPSPRSMIHPITAADRAVRSTHIIPGFQDHAPMHLLDFAGLFNKMVLLPVLKLSGIRPGQEQSPFTAEELGALRPVMTK